MNAIRVLVTGVCGRMGRLVAGTIRQTPDTLLVAGVDPAGVGKDLGEVTSGRKSGVVVRGELAPTIAQCDPQVMVDFTTPSAVMENLRVALSRKVACVVGTTGLSEKDIEEVRGLCDSHGTPAILAPNFSLGAVLMMRFAAEAASRYEYAQIIEAHHPAKKDTPSGTALLTAQRIAESRAGDMRFPQPELEQLPGTLGGQTFGIGVHALRMDGVIADQRVIFGGPGETLTIEHRTITRECFMPGVLLAVRKVLSQKGLVVGLENLL
ncbi:MAG: 4-hydroxy-tetrahydrodipicolinate reductase [Candidatus Zipacnadales bacterium]